MVIFYFEKLVKAAILLLKLKFIDLATHLVWFADTFYAEGVSF
jgi:hypothetical protein